MVFGVQGLAWVELGAPTTRMLPRLSERREAWVSVVLDDAVHVVNSASRVGRHQRLGGAFLALPSFDLG